jgi:hypothetical protein
MNGYETFWIRRFGGVVQDAIPEQIPVGMLADALNYELTPEGGLHPRLGYKLYAPTGTPDGRAIKTIFAADFDGTIRLLIATDQHVYEFAKATDTWSLVYTIVNTAAKRMTFCLLNAATAPVVVFGNGADDLKKWDGTTVSNCLNAPIGRPVAFKNYIAVFDIPDHPGRVQFAVNPGDTDTWSYGGQIKTLEMRGKVTSIYPFGGGLVVFTDVRTEYFVGDPDYAQTMSVLSETIGCASHETVVDCAGYLTWLSQAGVVTWNGSAMFPSSNLSDPDVSDGVVRSRCQRDIDRIAWDQRGLISAYYDPAKKKYYLSAKLRAVIGGDAFWRTFVYDFKYGGWFPWDLECTGADIFVESGQRQVPLVGTSSGALLARSTENFYDEGLASNREYPYWARFGDYDFDAPNHEKLFREIILGAGGVIEDVLPGDRTLNISLRGEFDRIAVDDVEMENPTGGFRLSISVLGDRLSSGYRFAEPRQPIAIRCKHINWRIHGQGSGNAVNLTAIAFSYKPTVKRSVLTKI